MSNKVLTIHPSYAQLNFLKKIIRHLIIKYNGVILHNQLHTTDHSHIRCLAQLRATPDSFLIIMCHGTPKNIRGCNRGVYGNHEYHWGTLISPETNIDVFDNKRVLCIACDSNTLGDDAINAGATAFIGFDSIRFFWPKTTDQESPITGVSRRSNSICRYEFRKSIEESIMAALDNNYTFNQLSLHLQFSLQNSANKRLALPKLKSKKINLEVAKSLMNIRQGIKIFGDGNAHIFNN